MRGGEPVSVDPGFVAAVVSAVAIVAAIVTIGVQLLASTRAATTHLAKGNALSTPPDGVSAAGTNVARPAASVAFDITRTDDAASRRRFSAQLNEYYAANISQGNAIFWASLLSMSVGFAIIFIGILTAGRNSANAVIAGIAGVFSQFIGATFLVALRSTQAQSTTYAQTLVELQLHDARAAVDARATTLGLGLLNEIAADGASGLANQTRATIATGLIVKDGAPVAAPASIAAIPVEAVDVAHVTPRTQPPARAESVSYEESATPGSQRSAPP
jgi:hypothetical protein